MRRVAAVLSAVLLLSACADDKPADTPASSGPPVVVPTNRPRIVVPSGPAPTQLVKTDLITGTGDFALPGKTVTVQYVGALYRNGEEFDATWEKGHPFTFLLGNQDVIAGWDEGVVGMRVGGRRQLVIPPDLGYGPDGDGSGVIGPNEPLIFVIDLVSVSGVIGPQPDETQGP